MREFIKKHKLYILIIIATLILLLGGTFAWYVWTSTTNATINLEVCTPTITFAGGDTINGTNIIPVTSKDNGLKKNITASISKSCSKSVTMNLSLELTTLPTALANSTFVYELYKNSTTKVTSGNFSGKAQGNTITLLSGATVTTTTDTYTLYIYIDGTKDNSTDMAGKSFTFKLSGSGSNAISS